MRKQLYWISESEWKRPEPLLSRGQGGAHRVDDRRVMSMPRLRAARKNSDNCVRVRKPHSGVTCPRDFGPPIK
jgi:transposase